MPLVSPARSRCAANHGHSLARHADGGGAGLSERLYRQLQDIGEFPVEAQALGQVMPVDRAGRVKVEPDLTIPGPKEVFVAGDLALFEQEGRPVLVALKAGDVRLNLNQDDGAQGWTRIKGLGFSINIWTTDDIDAIANRIKASGGKLDSEPVDAPWGARYFRLTDPDGFKLAVLKSLA